MQRLLNPFAMSWNHIKAEILQRHQHAVEHDEDEVRIVLAFDHGKDRVPLVVQRHDTAVVVLAQVAIGSTTQILAMLRAATMHGIALALIGDCVCVRASFVDGTIEDALQATARTALRLRRTTSGPRPDVAAFAFAM